MVLSTPQSSTYNSNLFESPPIAGTVHAFLQEVNFYGEHRIVGSPIPSGCGIALGLKYVKDGSVSFTMYGDGAAIQGQLFGALNTAALWELPAVLVCENNQLCRWNGTAVRRSTKNSACYKRGDYVPGLKVDGMDALAVKQSCKFAIEHASRDGHILRNYRALCLVFLVQLIYLEIS